MFRQIFFFSLLLWVGESSQNQKLTKNVIPVENTRFGLEWVRNLTNITDPGYAFLSPELPGQLVLTRFNGAPFFGKSYVSLVNLTTGKVQKDLATKIDWPNVATTVDASVFGFPAVIVGSGFLVPSHTTGGIWIMETGPNPKVLKQPLRITKNLNNWKPDSGWFYHIAEIVDVNGDGRADILTSRCADSVEPFNAKEGKLVWLEQPVFGAFNGDPWKEHIMADGPDFLIQMAPRKAGEDIEVCAAEYIGQRLSYVHGSNDKGWTTRVIDAELGNGFGCTWVDLNNDGKLDLLATNHLNQNGSVFAYTWEGSLSDNATVVHRHVLASGFNAVSKKTGTASPGDAIPFYPKTKASGKPLVLVSADNGNYISVLVPRSQDKNDWSYTNQFLYYVGADVGRIAIGDTDGDGMNELFVPAYDLGQLVHLRFVELSSSSSSSSWPISILDQLF